MATITPNHDVHHWQALLDSAGEGIWGLDLHGTCVFVNRMAARLLGFAPEETIGQNMHRLVHHHRPDGTPYPASECSITAILLGNEPFREQPDMMFRKDGSGFFAEVSAQPVLAAGDLAGVVVTFRDVTRLRAERDELDRAYREAEKRTAELTAVIESIPHAIYVANLDGSPVRLNEQARRMNGSSFPERLRTLELALAGTSSGDLIQDGDRWLKSTGAPVLLNGELIGGVAVNSDVTQAKLQDEALRKSEKLAAVGQLASSIAHEINNPLEAITNLLYLIRNSDTISEVQEYATIAQAELARVAEITLQTLRFHRQQTKPAQIDLCEVAQAVMSLYTGRLLVRNVTADWKAAAAPKVLCLEGEIRQVMNNLIRNALDAMNSGGHLSLRVHPQHDRRSSKTRSSEAGRAGVRLTIADTGEGIDPRIAAHLFEPFHTTKETTGTGLGLWVSRGIVEKHGGTISSRTSRGTRHGTVFSVWLPVAGAIPQSPSTN